jgi:MFS family permease
MAAQAQGRHYVPRLAIALFSLVPYILVASGAMLYRADVMHGIGATRNAMSVIEGLSTAGYAFGALFGGDLISRFRQRHMFIAGQCVFMAGWLLVALAAGPYSYGAGRVLAGFATGTLLVTSLPPVMRQFPPERLPVSAAFVNLGLFGAIAAGPLLGGFVAAEHAWREIYGGFALLGLFNIAVGLWTLPTMKPYNPDLPFDREGIMLALAATVLPFWASGELQSYGFSAPIVAVPLGVGLACFLALMLVEYHKREALSPVSKMWSTLPVVGTWIAMLGGGIFVTFVLLTAQFLLKVEGQTPLQTGLTYWPQVIGAIITAGVLGLVFHTRFLPLLAFAGMALLIAGGALLVLLNKGNTGAHLLAALGLLGLGAGATVSPGLFVAGLSLPSQMLGRIFALIELVRSVADFIMAPVLVRIAKISSSGHGLAASGIHEAMWVALLIAVCGTVLAGALYLLGGARLRQPDIQGWVEGNRPAVHSPKLLAAIRGE